MEFNTNQNDSDLVFKLLHTHSKMYKDKGPRIANTSGNQDAHRNG